jgi:phosphatidylglycerol:prolipoprotein diacylglycerol transferase
MFGLIEFDPIVNLHLGPLSISPHGLGTAVGFLAGAALLRPATRAQGIDDEVVNSMLWRAVVGAIIGARLAYVVNHFGEFRDDPLEMLMVWEGGISLLGGIAGGVLAAVPLMRRHALRFWPLMDAAAPGLALGILIGRVGDLVVGDHLGKPTDFALGFRCTGAETASRCAAPIGEGVHLPALYDLINVSILLAVLLVVRRRLRWDGFLILVFAAWYGAGRIAEDFFRTDVTHGTGLTGSQWAALVVVALSLWVLLIRRRTPRWGDWSDTTTDEFEPESTEPEDLTPVAGPDDEPSGATT